MMTISYKSESKKILKSKLLKLFRSEVFIGLSLNTTFNNLPFTNSLPFNFNFY